MDASRFFSNSAVTGNSGVVVAVALSWTAERCWNIANQLFTRCIEQANATCSSSSRHRHRHSSPPLGSLYVGDLGSLVYLRWRLSKLLLRLSSTMNDCCEQAKAEALLREALQIVETSSDDLNQHKIKDLRRVTLLESPQVGASALHAVLLHQTGQKRQAAALASSLIDSLDQACQNLPPSECDVLYGRAGALQAVLFLRSELQDPLLGTEAVMRLAADILTEGQLFATAQQQSNIGMPLLWEWHDSLYLGAAHGVTGIIQTLLSLSPSEIESLNCSHNMMALVKATIAKLDDFCFSPSGNLDSSIHVDDCNHRRRTDRLVQWCHGAPGHILLLLKAHQVFGEEAYLQKAKQIADQVVWPRGLLRKGVGLCHGIAGNAYVLLELGKFDPQYIDKAGFFAEFALEHLRELEPIPDRPYSLYEGLGGLCVLAMDLAFPQDAKFPLYTF